MTILAARQCPSDKQKGLVT